MKNENYIKDLTNAIEQKIASVIPAGEPKEINVPLKYLMSGGGKRLRPILALLSCGAVSGNCLNSLDAAVAMEFIHNSTLAHDDIMDNSPLRRGRETIHKKWDVSTAILVGDIMLGYAYKLLNRYRKHDNYPLLVDTLNKALIDVYEGQAYDMKSDTEPNITLPEYYKMIGLKTAVLIQSAVRLGALIGNATEEQINALDNFAFAYGIAFQIQDDLLDITADQSKFGKPTGQDILEGKKTFLVLKAKELANDADDKELINKYLNSKGLPASAIPEMKSLFEKLEIFTIAEKEIDKMTTRAIESLAVFNDNEFSEILIDLVSSLLTRSK